MKENDLPVGKAPFPLKFPHFPTLFQAVVWRNFGMLTTKRLAKVLGTSAERILETAHGMRLTDAASESTEKLWLQRGYVTLIRQNWHLLPYSQLLALLDWTPEQMAYSLKEDDFLWHKLGELKPRCKEVRFQPPTPAEAKKTVKLERLVKVHFRTRKTPPKEMPFDFLKSFHEVPQKTHPCGNEGTPPVRESSSSFQLRLAYSYSAVFGDPLAAGTDPYPEGLLSRLAENGINAVWLQGVLYSLVPWFGENEFTKGYWTRIRNLNMLTEKASKYGIGVYLYLNEPRGMPRHFFKEHPDWKGATHLPTNSTSLCMSIPELLTLFRDGVSELFRRAPRLAGAFTITASENPTHCHSHSFSKEVIQCKNCSRRPPEELTALVNNTIAEGAHRANPKADIIVWDWGWNPEWAGKVIDRLHSDIRFMSTSEAFLETEAMGVKGLVGDYSISKVGPGQWATENWKHASARGFDTIAKVQLNNTWECSAVPYLPVPFLVNRHLQNLKLQNISGLMVSWTLGGYPGGNLMLVRKEPETLARERFGIAPAPLILEAWRIFGEAFMEFPLHGTFVLYNAPQNYGPMNLLHARKTGYKATMLGFPYDDLKSWRGTTFSESLLEEQFRKLGTGWNKGIRLLRKAACLVPCDRKENFEDLMNVAVAAYCHFRSTCLQIRFIRLRDSANKKCFTAELNSILDEEIKLAKTLLKIVRKDSRIGFEASNHYYYTENSLKEKVLNCESMKTCMIRK